MLTLAEAVLWHGLSAVLKVIEPFRKEHSVQPHERDTRDFEWNDFSWCIDCKFIVQHTYIEWMPERAVTKECHDCNLETNLV